MSIDFRTLVPAETRRAMLEQNIQAWALDGYANQVNKENAEAIGDAAAVAQAEANMATIATAIANAQAELETLPPPSE